VRLGDFVLQGVAGAAAFASLGLVALIVIEIVHRARPAYSAFGFSFVYRVIWDPVHDVYGAGSYLFGTVITSFGALLLAAPLAIGIGLFLSELAPKGILAPVTALVETLAAIPSVVIGLWGLIVLAPFLRDHVDPALHSVLGFIPLFGQAAVGPSLFTAIIVLTIMILPIIASISRELFLAVPSELKEGALGLGATRWQMVRGVSLSYSRSGIAAAMILGLGRALGEAIAVTQVIGGGTEILWNLFTPGDTLASKIAANYQGTSGLLETPALLYLATILLVFSLITSVLAQLIVRHAARQHGAQ